MNRPGSGVAWCSVQRKANTEAAFQTGQPVHPQPVYACTMFMGQACVAEVTSHKHLGVYITNNLSWGLPVAFEVPLLRWFPRAKWAQSSWGSGGRCEPPSGVWGSAPEAFENYAFFFPSFDHFNIKSLNFQLGLNCGVFQGQGFVDHKTRCPSRCQSASSRPLLAVLQYGVHSVDKVWLFGLSKRQKRHPFCHCILVCGSVVPHALHAQVQLRGEQENKAKMISSVISEINLRQTDCWSWVHPVENCDNYKIHLSVRAKLIKSSHLDLQVAWVQFLRGRKTSCPLFLFDGVKRTPGRQKPP